MGPAAEPLVTAPEMVPSLLGATLRVVGMLALLGVGAWLFVKRRSFQRGGRAIEVIDRAFLARGTSVALLRVGQSRLLLGITPSHVRLLRDLGAEGSFAEALATVDQGHERPVRGTPAEV
jgi:flagellar biogenesis protein FliO